MPSCSHARSFPQSPPRSLIRLAHSTIAMIGQALSVHTPMEPMCSVTRAPDDDVDARASERALAPRITTTRARTYTLYLSIVTCHSGLDRTPRAADLAARPSAICARAATCISTAMLLQTSRQSTANGDRHLGRIRMDAPAGTGSVDQHLFLIQFSSSSSPWSAAVHTQQAYAHAHSCQHERPRRWPLDRSIGPFDVRSGDQRNELEHKHSERDDDSWSWMSEESDRQLSRKSEPRRAHRC